MLPIAIQVAWSVCVCVCVCVYIMVMSTAKTAEPIEMLFGVWARVGPYNHLEGPA